MTALLGGLLLLQLGCGDQPDPSMSAQLEQELTRLRQENAELQRLRAENEELSRLRRDNEELRRLREQTADLEKLRKENAEIRGQLEALKAPKPRP